VRASMMSFVLVIVSVLPAAAQIAPNTDRPGGDYKGVYLKNASECQSACSGDKRCVAWTFVKRDRHCMLKDSTPQERSDTCCDSGAMLRGLGKVPKTRTSSPPPSSKQTPQDPGNCIEGWNAKEGRCN